MRDAWAQHTSSTLDLSRSKCSRDGHEDLSRALRHVGEEEPCGVGRWRRPRSNGKACTCLTLPHSSPARLPMLNYLTVRADTHSSIAVSPISSRSYHYTCLLIRSFHLTHTVNSFYNSASGCHVQNRLTFKSPESWIPQRIYCRKVTRARKRERERNII